MTMIFRHMIGVGGCHGGTRLGEGRRRMRKRLMYEETRLWSLLDDPASQPLDEPDRIMSQRELAERIGVHESYLSRMRSRGKKLAKARGEAVDPTSEWEPVRIPAWLAQCIAEEFGLPVEEVFRKPQWYTRQGRKMVPTDPPGPEDEIIEEIPPERQAVPGLMTLTQATATTGVADSTLRHAILRGRLKAINFGGQWLVTEKALREYLDSRRTWRGAARPQRGAA